MLLGCLPLDIDDVRRSHHPAHTCRCDEFNRSAVMKNRLDGTGYRIELFQSDVDRLSGPDGTFHDVLQGKAIANNRLFA